MRPRVPPKRVRDRFLIIYELQGAQKAINFLTEHYQVRKMRIILNGRKAGKTCVAYYENNKAVFKKRGLNRRNVLHEFYHHLVNCKSYELSERTEENEANRYVRKFLSVCL